ncbi:MAG: hypothetical protein J5J00_12750 [Deltaproteobacteria bacterium]|nr:hypothetical protein [Deltaproteobacteria bacterium]
MKLLIALLGRLPLRVRVALGRFLGSVFSYVPTRERRIAELQMRLFLKEHYSPDLIRRLYAGLGQTLMECINLTPILSRLEQFVETEDSEIIRSVISEKRPIVTLTGHLGNWDLLAAYIIASGIAVTTIGREARSHSLQAILADIRATYGIKTIWRSNSSGVKEIVSDLKSGRVVAALIDQDTDVSSSLIPFFGVPVRCPSGLVAIGKKMDAIITTAFITRGSDSRYKVHVKRLDAEKSIEEILHEYHIELEKHIRHHPEQWVWIHKRWRTLPDGERLSSKRYINYLTERLQSES